VGLLPEAPDANFPPFNAPTPSCRDYRGTILAGCCAPHCPRASRPLQVGVFGARPQPSFGEEQGRCWFAKPFTMYELLTKVQGLLLETHGLAGPSTDFLTRDRRRIPRRRREAPPPIGKSHGALDY
jgi:hypothetical protein